MASLEQDVSGYEDWLRDQCKVVEPDLREKHERMQKSAFVFLRATYFRWARTIEHVCPGLQDAPRVLCVGDTHVENYGTWRDGDGRQVWGLNDFDEAAVMPYPYDLIRLVASATLSGRLDVDPQGAAGAVLEGYAGGLHAPGPALLEQGASWFRRLVGKLADETDEFWKDLADLEDVEPPRKVRRSLRRSFPDGAAVCRFVTRRKGAGGLGRPRYLAIADWQGGHLVREARAIVPSAWSWAHPESSPRPRALDVAYGRYRAPDASLRIAGRFLLRRIAPESRKLDLEEVARRGLGVTLLEAMGREIGAIHAAHRRGSMIDQDLARRGPDWLHAAATLAAAAVESDHAHWCSVVETFDRSRS